LARARATSPLPARTASPTRSLRSAARRATFKTRTGARSTAKAGSGPRGQIFRFEDRSIFDYWDTSALHPADEDNPTAPFSTKDYDATTLLRCKTAGDAEYGNCPAGILRMEDGHASIVVQSQRGEQFTINFMRDYTNATNHEVDTRLEGDTWIVNLDNGEAYEVPLAAIEGG
jgi:hypothetical protein